MSKFTCISLLPLLLALSAHALQSAVKDGKTQKYCLILDANVPGILQYTKLDQSKARLPFSILEDGSVDFEGICGYLVDQKFEFMPNMALLTLPEEQEKWHLALMFTKNRGTRQRLLLQDFTMVLRYYSTVNLGNFYVTVPFYYGKPAKVETELAAAAGSNGFCSSNKLPLNVTDSFVQLNKLKVLAYATLDSGEFKKGKAVVKQSALNMPTEEEEKQQNPSGGVLAAEADSLSISEMMQKWLLMEQTMEIQRQQLNAKLMQALSHDHLRFLTQRSGANTQQQLAKEDESPAQAPSPVVATTAVPGQQPQQKTTPSFFGLSDSISIIGIAAAVIVVTMGSIIGLYVSKIATLRADVNSLQSTVKSHGKLIAKQRDFSNALGVQIAVLNSKMDEIADQAPSLSASSQSISAAEAVVPDPYCAANELMRPS